MTYINLVVGLELVYFSIHWECHHPNWLSLHFSEGLVAQPPISDSVTGTSPKKDAKHRSPGPKRHPKMPDDPRISSMFAVRCEMLRTAMSSLSTWIPKNPSQKLYQLDPWSSWFFGFVVLIWNDFEDWFWYVLVYFGFQNLKHCSKNTIKCKHGNPSINIGFEHIFCRDSIISRIWTYIL